jgi:FKBP-type peptidyl-prolyl cis-trans isomerase
MKRSIACLLSGILVFAAGCAPQQPAAPVVPEKSEAEVRRERWFGAELAQKPGIEWRSSGLGIEVLAPGTGTPPKSTDKVRVHYRGLLLDGTEFDSSYARGKPNDFVLNQLITGWAAAMPSLRPGGKAVFYIPPQLGYGGIRAGKIPPNSSLIFEVELLEVLTP